MIASFFLRVTAHMLFILAKYGVKTMLCEAIEKALKMVSIRVRVASFS